MHALLVEGNLPLKGPTFPHSISSLAFTTIVLGALYMPYTPTPTRWGGKFPIGVVHKTKTLHPQ